MTDSLDAVRRFMNALSDPDQIATELPGVLADGVSSSSPLGTAAGKESVLESLANPMIAPLFANATWTEPARDGETLSATATMEPGAMIGGAEFKFRFDGLGLITEIDQRIIPAPPPPPAEIELTDQIAEALGGALVNGTPVIVAYVDDQGYAHLSYRGTAQVHSSNQLAIWVRDPDGGLPRNIESHPQITAFYSDRAARTGYHFYGRARVATDDATRTAVFEGSPEVEQNFDQGRRGAAIVIDLDRVEGSVAGDRFTMERGAG